MRAWARVHMNREGERGAHRSPWLSFKERALYLAMKFGKFRIWHSYELYKIEKALPKGKVSQSLFSRQIFENKHKNRRREGESWSTDFPLRCRSKEKFTKNSRPEKGELAVFKPPQKWKTYMWNLTTNGVISAFTLWGLWGSIRRRKIMGNFSVLKEVEETSETLARKKV